MQPTTQSNTATLTRELANPSDPLTELPPIKLLLVEDDDLDAELLIRQLTASSDHAFDVTRATGLRAAMRELLYGDFDCVVLDLGLPDASGLAGCDALLAHPRDLPVVVLTGSDDADEAIDAVMRGAQDFLTKDAASPKAIERAIRLAVARDDSERHFHDRLRALADPPPPANELSVVDLADRDPSAGIASRLLAEVVDAIERAETFGENAELDSTEGPPTEDPSIND
ncbi:MAG: response regulator [Actinomycetota bacterium]